jgi:hypothetical protein
MPANSADGRYPRTWPSLSLALLLPCGLLILMGLTDDREPPPPVGVLTPATMVGVTPVALGRSALPARPSLTSAANI